MARDGERGRGDRKDRRGQDPYAAEGTGDSGPVDIAAVRRDDALIDAIAGDGPVQTGDPAEFQLASLLADWRAEVLAEPMPAGPDLDTVFAAVNQEIGARQVRVGASSRGRLRLVRPIFGAAAALAVVMGGLTAFSYSAAPGDPLWRVKEVVFSEQAQSTVVQRTDGDLVAAQAMLDQGNPEQARARLEQASATAAQINDPRKRDDLIARWNLLHAELAKRAPEIAKSLTPNLPTPSPTKPADGATTPASPGSVTPGTPGTSPDSVSPETPANPGTVSPTKPPVDLKPTDPVDTKPTEPPVTTPPVVTTPPPATTPPPVTTPPVVTPEPTVPSVPAVEPTAGPITTPPTVPTGGAGVPATPPSFVLPGVPAR
ncbi:anti-sigma-D factor RsdA [Nocardia thailandica]